MRTCEPPAGPRPAGEIDPTGCLIGPVYHLRRAATPPAAVASVYPAAGAGVDRPVGAAVHPAAAAAPAPGVAAAVVRSAADAAAEAAPGVAVAVVRSAADPAVVAGPAVAAVRSAATLLRRRRLALLWRLCARLRTLLWWRRLPLLRCARLRTLLRRRRLALLWRLCARLRTLLWWRRLPLLWWRGLPLLRRRSRCGAAPALLRRRCARLRMRWRGLPCFGGA